MHPSSSCYVVRTHTRNKSVIFFSPSCVKTSEVIAAETINTYLEAKSSVLTNTRIPSCITISAFLCFLHHGTWMMPRCYGKYCSYIVSTKHHQKCVLAARVQKSDTHSLRQKMRQSTMCRHRSGCKILEGDFTYFACFLLIIICDSFISRLTWNFHLNRPNKKMLCTIFSCVYTHTTQRKWASHYSLIHSL